MRPLRSDSDLKTKVRIGLEIMARSCTEICYSRDAAQWLPRSARARRAGVARSASPEECYDAPGVIVIVMKVATALRTAEVFSTAAISVHQRRTWRRALSRLWGACWRQAYSEQRLHLTRPPDGVTYVCFLTVIRKPTHALDTPAVLVRCILESAQQSKFLGGGRPCALVLHERPTLTARRQDATCSLRSVPDCGIDA